MILKRLRDTAVGLWSLLVGLKVTALNFVSPQITIHFPREVSPTLEGFRGHIELVPSEEDPFKSKCIACGNCVRACPSACITMKATKPKKKEAEGQESASSDTAAESGEEKKAPAKKAKPELIAFSVNFNYCCLCGLCVENCPAGALRFSQNYYLAGFTREEFDIDLLARLESKAKEQ
ncbi:MAG: 4Fe-4S binding protein [Thermodesulfobacteriota bacterium]